MAHNERTYDIYARIPRSDEETPGEWLTVIIPENIDKPTFNDLIEEISQHTLRDMGLTFLDVNCRIRVGTVDTKDLEPNEVDYYIHTQTLFLDIVDDEQVEKTTRGGAHSIGNKFSDIDDTDEIPSRKPRFVLTCRCLNTDCQAYNEAVDINEIIVPNQIDLGTLSNDQRLWCKTCYRDERMEVTNCLFTVCEWKYKARRPIETTLIDSGFQTERIGTFFDKQLIEQLKIEEWANFQIITRQIPARGSNPPETVPDDRQPCEICLSEIKEYTEKFHQTPCNHFFHKSCLNKWIKTSLKDYNYATCPDCRAILNDFPDRATFQRWLSPNGP